MVRRGRPQTARFNWQAEIWSGKICPAWWPAQWCVTIAKHAWDFSILRSVVLTGRLLGPSQIKPDVDINFKFGDNGTWKPGHYLLGMPSTQGKTGHSNSMYCISRALSTHTPQLMYALWLLLWFSVMKLLYQSRGYLSLDSLSSAHTSNRLLRPRTSVEPYLILGHPSFYFSIFVTVICTLHMLLLGSLWILHSRLARARLWKYHWLLVRFLVFCLLIKFPNRQVQTRRVAEYPSTNTSHLLLSMLR